MTSDPAQVRMDDIAFDRAVALHPFTSGELRLHHRAGGPGSPITCGVSHGCITSVVDDVRCKQCLSAFAEKPSQPVEEAAK